MDDSPKKTTESATKLKDFKDYGIFGSVEVIDISEEFEDFTALGGIYRSRGVE